MRCLRYMVALVAVAVRGLQCRMDCDLLHPLLLLSRVGVRPRGFRNRHHSNNITLHGPVMGVARASLTVIAITDVIADVAVGAVVGVGGG